MTTKLDVVNELGETGLLLPDLITRGLAANDRVKYYLTLMQAAKAHAEHPATLASDLRLEREASGVEDATLDDVIADSRKEAGGMVWLPHGQRLHDLVFGALREMLAPVSASRDAPGRETYEQRLEDLLAHAWSCEGDVMPSSYIDGLGRAEGPADSVHRLVMDLHRELNRLQAAVARESVDGASTYGLEETDRTLVRAFMRGLNSTAPLKFDHPGLATTAARAGARLTIQNDLGTTDAHVVVIHVEGLAVTVIYTDVHPARAAFFRDLLAPHDVRWSGSEAPPGAAYELSVGRVDTADQAGVGQYLSFLGSRLVFLIDWNRARKRLQRFVRKSDAIAVLRWAADANVGHRAFLQAGETRLVATALERTHAEIRYGMRLDEFLGRDEARAFLQAVLRLSAEGLQASRSLRLIQDEIEAELLARVQTAEHSAFGLAADHAAFIWMLADRLQHAVARAGSRRADGYVQRTAELAKRWETQADDIVKHSRRLVDRSAASGANAHLLVTADDVADGLEEAAFFLTLLPSTVDRAAIGALQRLADLLSQDARQYVSLIEQAKAVPHASDRADIDRFLVAVDHVVELEHSTDAAEREVQAMAISRVADFRELHAISAIGAALEHAADGLARCALMIRDRVLEGLAERS
ncbi:MAG TPA: hypothetical protein VLT86_09205 [Vicinamibacterales bacterium]|nr:hypothetical protein [Vicinamibacterales bacterium]